MSRFRDDSSVMGMLFSHTRLPVSGGVQGCSAASGQLTFLGYAICLFVSGFPALILCERVDLEPCKLARGFGEHLLCIYVDGSRRRPLPSLEVPIEFLTSSFSAGSPLSHIPTRRFFLLFLFISSTKRLNIVLLDH